MNTNPVIKLTLVSMVHGRIRVSKFVNALYVDGKAYISKEVCDELKRQAALKRELLPPELKVRQHNVFTITPQIIHAHQEPYILD